MPVDALLPVARIASLGCYTNHPGGFLTTSDCFQYFDCHRQVILINLFHHYPLLYLRCSTIHRNRDGSVLRAGDP